MLYDCRNPFRRRLRGVSPVEHEGSWLQAVRVSRVTCELEVPDCDRSGGRFNPPGVCAMTYLSQDTPACRARMRPWCGRDGSRLERIILVFRIRVGRLLDLCDPRTRYDLDLTRAELVGPDLDIPRLVGVAAFLEEYEGILYPRPRTSAGVNLALYRSRAQSLEVSVVDRLGAGPGAARAPRARPS